MINDNEYFYKGDLVTLVKDVANSPEMLVTKIEKMYSINADGSRTPILLGVRCMWFDKKQRVQHHIFNTKDIKKVQV